MLKEKLICTLSAALAVLSLSAGEVFKFSESLKPWRFSGVKAAPVITDGVAAMSAGAKKTIVINAGKLAVPAENNLIQLYVKSAPGNTVVFCYFATDTEPALSESKKLAFYGKFSGSWQKIELNAAKNKNWKGKITQLRFDVNMPGENTFDIAKIALTSPAEQPCVWDFREPGAVPIPRANGLKSPAVVADKAMKLEFQKQYSVSPVIPVNFPAADKKYLFLRFRTTPACTMYVSMYFKTAESPNLDEAKKVVFKSSSTSQWQVVKINLSAYKSWKGTITGIRPDLTVSSASCTVDFSDIVFTDDENWTPPTPPAAQLGPWFDLRPGAEFLLEFQANSSGIAKFEIYDTLNRICRSLPVTHKAGIGKVRFTMPENGAKAFFSGNGKTMYRTVKLASVPEKHTVKKNWKAYWIADPDKHHQPGGQYFQRVVNLDAEPLDCRFQGTADDRMDLYINGARVPLPEGVWQNPRQADVTGFFKKGENIIAVYLHNNGEASGLLGNFLLHTADGRLISVDTDKEFKVLRNPSPEWKTAVAFDSVEPKIIGPYNSSPWGEWKLIPYEDFQIRDQLKIENVVLTPIDGGVSAEFSITATLLRRPLESLTVKALSGHTVIAGEKIMLDSPLKSGDRVVLKRNLFAGRLFPGSYRLDFSGGDTHVTAFDTRFAVTDFSTAIPPLKSEVIRTPAGTAIYLNGKPLNSIIYAGSAIDTLKEFYDAGVRCFIVQAGDTMGKGRTSPGWNEDGYDFTELDRRVNRFYANFPEAVLILSFGVDAPAWWVKRYPQECVLLEGKTRHESLSSPASELWRQEAAKFVKALVSYVEKSPYAGKIMAYRIASLCDGGEWQYPGVWGERKHADFSEAMKRYFRKYMSRKYGSSRDFSQLNVPAGSMRRIPSETAFRNPSAERDVIDYILCQSDAVAESAIELLRAAKSVSNGKPVGIYGGYLLMYSGYPVQNAAHLAFGKIYNSKAADFFAGPVDYHLRRLGHPGGNMASMGSIQLANAVYLQENDSRTFLNVPSDHRHVSNLFESAAVLYRDLALSLTENIPHYFCEIAGGSWANQGLMEAVEKMQSLFRSGKWVTDRDRREVAMLYSVESLPYLVEKNDRETEASSFRLRRNAGLSGVPFDTYLLEDILNDNFPLRYKCYVVVNAFRLSPEVQRAVREKLCRNGATVVFTPGAGLFKGDAVSLDNMQKLTGFSFKTAKGRIPAVPTETAKPYLVRENGTFRSIYAMKTDLPSDLWREIFRKAGAHVFVNSNDAVGYNGRILYIHAASAGEKEIFLPGVFRVTDFLSGKTIAEKCRSFRTGMLNSETKIFLLDEEK